MFTGAKESTTQARCFPTWIVYFAYSEPSSSLNITRSAIHQARSSQRIEFKQNLQTKRSVGPLMAGPPECIPAGRAALRGRPRGMSAPLPNVSVIGISPLCAHPR